MAKVSSAAPGGNESRKASSVPLPKSKRGLKGFFSDVRRELTKVDWPTVPETHRLTLIVLTVCGMLAVVITVLSLFFEKLVNLITKGTM
ncbi:MAG: preprotein translocase subunit SecE [Fimbriimonadaceae bacterium]|nr:preprotein translocase subunit SecE [Fimbriimonadaceae bacterium]